MKPKNFPARKLARRVAADMRRSGGRATARSVLAIGCKGGTGVIDGARAVRTKKTRGSR